MKITADTIRALFPDDVEFRKTTIRNFVMNQENSYEDRLDIYLHTPEHLQHVNQWIFHHPTMLDDEWHPDYMERHTEESLVDMPDYHEWDEETTKKWYRGCMDMGVWSFIMDW